LYYLRDPSERHDAERASCAPDVVRTFDLAGVETMQTDVWKISVNLRKKSGPVVTVAGRGHLGNTLRTGGLANGPDEVRRVVMQAFEQFEEFDEVEYENAMRLSATAQNSQLDEQEQKGQK